MGLSLFNRKIIGVSKKISIKDQSSIKHQPVENYTPIEILRLSERTLNGLINNGVKSIGQLLKYTPNQIQTFQGIGSKALREIESALFKKNLKLSKVPVSIRAIEQEKNITKEKTRRSLKIQPPPPVSESELNEFFNKFNCLLSIIINPHNVMIHRLQI